MEGESYLAWGKGRLRHRIQRCHSKSWPGAWPCPVPDGRAMESGWAGQAPLRKALATVLARFLFDVKFPCLQIFTRFTWRINLHWKLWDFYINFHIFASFHVKFFRGCGIVPWSHKWLKLKVIGILSFIIHLKILGKACVRIKNVIYKFISLFIQSVLLHTCYVTVTISVQEQQRKRHARTHPELSSLVQIFRPGFHLQSPCHPAEPSSVSLGALWL